MGGQCRQFKKKSAGFIAVGFRGAFQMVAYLWIA
jgi:hypothetical protein